MPEVRYETKCLDVFTESIDRRPVMLSRQRTNVETFRKIPACVIAHERIIVLKEWNHLVRQEDHVGSTFQ